MAESHGNNSFVLFPEKSKKNERSPSATGAGKVTCPHCGQEVELRLVAWRRTSKRDPNLQFMGGQIEPVSMKVGPRWADDCATMNDDDIPF